MFSYFGVTTPFDGLNTLVTSYALSPLALAIARCIMATYTLSVLVFAIVWDSVKEHTGSQFFSYFTHLTYIGICAYFFASGVQTIAYRRRGMQSYSLQTWPRILQLCHVILLSTIITFPILVSIVYWGLLATPEVFSNKYNAWSAISMHAFNTVFVLFEICLTNVPIMPWLTLVPSILILGGYVGIAYITHETQGFYSYSFLDPQKQKAKLAIYIVGIPVAQCVIFCLVQCAILARQKLTKRSGQRLNSAFSDSQGTSSPRSLGSWESVRVSKETVTYTA